MRTCTKCGITRPVSDFHKATRSRDGYHTQCALCRRAYLNAYLASRPDQRAKRRERNRNARLDPSERARQNALHYARNRADPERVALNDRRWLLKKRGLTIEKYDAMLARQGGGCAICGGTKGKGPKGNLHIDHDHTSGVVRGLLCSPCNNALGLFRDSPDLLARAAIYLSEARMSDQEPDDDTTVTTEPLRVHAVVFIDNPPPEEDE